jgi:hypothetical protein
MRCGISGAGVSVCNAALHQVVPRIASDTQGGAIITWQDNRTATNDIYAQRIDADGASQWTNNGVPVCNATSHPEQSLHRIRRCARRHHCMV